MKKCKSCQIEIDNKVQKCPNCKTDQRSWFMRHKILTIILAFVLIGVISNMGKKSGPNNPIENQSTQEQTTAVFDIEKLYRKNINEIRSILGSPSDGNLTDPTAQQIALGTKEWSNTFKKDNYELLVTYDVSSKQIVDFFIPTNDPSGATKDIEKLKKIGNVLNSTNFVVEPVKTLKDKSVYTGIKIIPIQAK